MCEILFPASPNWYSASAFDAFNEYLYYVGNSYLNVFKMLNAESSPQFVACIPAHVGRGMDVSACPSKTEVRCCTVGEDGCAKVWDILSKSCANTHKDLNNNIFTAVHWTTNADLILLGDNKGSLHIWYVSQKKLKVHPLVKSEIACIKCSPHKIDLVCIGFKNGCLTLVDISRNAVLVHSLRGHSLDIQGLCWSPHSSHELLESCPSLKEHDLSLDNGIIASSSKDNNVHVWDAYSGKLLATVNTIKKCESHHKVWVSLSWLMDNVGKLVCSTSTGAIQLWDINCPKNRPVTWLGTPMVRVHNRLVFCMVNPYPGVLVSSSMDRQIIIWNSRNGQASAQMWTIGGTVTCVNQAKCATGHIAFGCSDNVLRVWKVGSTLTSANVQTFWQGIKSKITVLSWHPEREGLLTYGAEDGCVGVVDIFQHKKPPMMSSFYHACSVNTLSWGPPPFDDTWQPTKKNGSVPHLYSCSSDGQVLVHTIDQKFGPKTAVLWKLPMKEDDEVDRVMWNDDATVCAVCYKSGNVSIIGSSIVNAAPSVFDRPITSLAWHPSFTSTDQSSFRGYLAVACMAVIKVVSLDAPPVQLQGHLAKVTSLAWSSHTDGLLASGSYDNTVQIWDILSGSPLVNYRGHHSGVTCVIFSDMFDDVVISGSNDNTLQVWSISKQTEKLPPSIQKQSKKGKKKHLEVTGEATPIETLEIESETSTKVDHCTEAEELKKMLEEKRLELMLKQPQPSDSINGEWGEYEVEVVDGNKKSRRKFRSLFPLTSSMESRKKQERHRDIIELHKAKSGATLSPEFCHLGYFIDRRLTLQVIEGEKRHHKQSNHTEPLYYMDLVKGDLVGMLRQAVAKDQLNDFMISLIPRSNQDLWTTMCSEYVKQLDKRNSPHKACAYLLALNKVYEAIEVLQRHGHHRDALALARSRLSARDPVIPDCLVKWAKVLTDEGNVETAALCHLSVDEPLAASRVLLQRTDAGSLSVASQLCLTDVDLLATCLLRLYAASIEQRVWKPIEDIIPLTKEVKPCALVVSTLSVFLTYLHKLELLPSAFEGEHALCTVNQQLLQHVRQFLKSHPSANESIKINNKDNGGKIITEEKNHLGNGHLQNVEIPIEVQNVLLYHPEQNDEKTEVLQISNALAFAVNDLEFNRSALVTPSDDIITTSMKCSILCDLVHCWVQCCKLDLDSVQEINEILVKVATLRIHKQGVLTTNNILTDICLDVVQSVLLTFIGNIERADEKWILVQEHVQQLSEVHRVIVRLITSTGDLGTVDLMDICAHFKDEHAKYCQVIVEADLQDSQISAMEEAMFVIQ